MRQGTDEPASWHHHSNDTPQQLRLVNQTPSFSGIISMLRSIWRDESNQDERGRRILRAGGWQLWKRIARSPVQVGLFNGMRFRAYPDCTVSSSAVYFRVPNYRHVEFIRRHVRGGTLLDIGANVGLFTLLLADRVEHAILFEPNPLAAARARENMQLNRLNCEVVEMAASDQGGEVIFENAGGASPVNRTVVGFSTSLPIITVQRQALDSFLAERRLAVPVSVVKIDVEGHENSVLYGMRSCMREMRPLIMFEYLARTNLRETFEIFAGAGYRVLAFSQSGKLEPATLAVKPLQDLFASPEEDCARLVA
ncbi:MAG TPA: FkbM family methyltransferase [Terriglobales bacterium]